MYMVAEYATPKNNYMFTLYSIHTVYPKIVVEIHLFIIENWVTERNPI